MALAKALHLTGALGWPALRGQEGFALGSSMNANVIRETKRQDRYKNSGHDDRVRNVRHCSRVRRSTHDEDSDRGSHYLHQRGRLSSLTPPWAPRPAARDSTERSVTRGCLAASC